MIRKYVFKSRFTIPSIDSVIEANLIPSKDLKKGQFRLLEVTERLILPRNVVVRFLVTSTDVLHS
jgi:heme/copper-type cytochrome/quinol oxidase subunit 2